MWRAELPPGAGHACAGSVSAAWAASPLAPCAVLAAPPAAVEAKHTVASRRRCKVALVAAALVVIMPSAVGG